MMPRQQFQVAKGARDTAEPGELLELVTAWQTKYNLRTQYAALAEMLRCAISMDRTPTGRRPGADYSSTENKKQSGTTQGRRKRRKPADATAKAQDD
jgi:hypothetical protein